MKDIFEQNYNYGQSIGGNLLFVDAYWFSGGGLVLLYDKYDGYKAYIKDVHHLSYNNDINAIAANGDKFPLVAVRALLPHINFSVEVKETPQLVE